MKDQLNLPTIQLHNLLATMLQRTASVVNANVPHNNQKIIHDVSARIAMSQRTDAWRNIAEKYHV